MITINKSSLLNKLFDRGDQINIVNGLLTIQPQSQKEVPKKWFRENKEELVSDIAALFSIDVYIYDRYSTGQYGKHKSQGVTLQLLNITTGEDAYMVFNAELKRQRNSGSHKAGALLPEGQFRVSKNRAFYKWWLSTGLKFPPRLSSFHSYMGNLKTLFFVASPDDQGKITDKMIPTFNVTHENINELLGDINADKPHTANIQETDNAQTTMTDKQINVGLEDKGLQSNLSTGFNKCGTRLYGNMNISNSLPLVNLSVRPQDQTTEEWLSNWDNA
jgi:hypothetical protein